MPHPLYLDTARFGSILPECAEMLREFASLLETQGQFPEYEVFLQQGAAAAWPDRLLNRFPTLAQWTGLAELRDRILTLCGVTSPATVLFSSASRHLARVAFQLLTHRCERVLCSDADWPEFQEMLRQQMLQAGGQLYRTQLDHTPFADATDEPREKCLADAWKRNGCDGVLLTAVSAGGLLMHVDRFRAELETDAQAPFLVVDGSQQAGHVPVELGDQFRGIYIAGTHKWLCSGVPLSFGIFTLEDDSSAALMPIRKALRVSLVDDSMLLQTANVGLKNPRQTTRIEPLLAADLAIRHALQSGVQDLLQVRRRNAERIWDIVDNLPVSLNLHACNGIVSLETRSISALALHRHLSAAGIAVSVLGDDRLRISCPARELTNDELDQLEQAFFQFAEDHLAMFDNTSDPDGYHSVA